MEVSYQRKSSAPQLLWRSLIKKNITLFSSRANDLQHQIAFQFAQRDSKLFYPAIWGWRAHFEREGMITNDFENRSYWKKPNHAREIAWQSGWQCNSSYNFCENFFYSLKHKFLRKIARHVPRKIAKGTQPHQYCFCAHKVSRNWSPTNVAFLEVMK